MAHTPLYSPSDSEKDSVLSGPTPTPSVSGSPQASKAVLSLISSRTSDCSPTTTVATTPNASNETLVAYDAHKTICPLSTSRLVLAHAGAALTLFLATTDATIVSTALPTITNEFNAGQAEYTWVSVTYMLTQTAFQPLYGKLSDLVGRTTVLYASIFIFAAGSALCGAAQNMTWLILARALAGVGGGGIVSLVWTITSEIVDVRNQAKWSQALSITWACSAVAGPLLGGLFSNEHGPLNWRWAFYINLPVCGLAFVILWVSLRRVYARRVSDLSWGDFGRTFDFLGLLLFMGGSSCIVIGFNFATQIGWSSASTVSLIAAGVVVLLLGAIHEGRTTRDALFPPIAFKDRTILATLAVTFLHNFAFTAGTFYLAVYFQAVHGLKPLQAGMAMLPYSLGSSLASMPTAWVIGYWTRRRFDTLCQKYVIAVGLAVSALGFGLMMLMTENTSASINTVFPLIAGMGIGMLFHAPYQVFSRALSRQEVASGTSAFFLVRFTGATVGLAAAGAVFLGQLSQSLPAGVDPANILENVDNLRPTSAWPAVVAALALAIRAIWMVCAPCLLVALLISMLTRNIVITVSTQDDRAAAQGPQTPAACASAPSEDVDLEKQQQQPSQPPPLLAPAPAPAQPPARAALAPVRHGAAHATAAADASGLAV